MAGLGAWKALTQWESAHAVVALPPSIVQMGTRQLHTPSLVCPGFLNLSTTDIFGLANPFVEAVLCAVGH